jgi:hypothetical protein
VEAVVAVLVGGVGTLLGPEGSDPLRLWCVGVWLLGWPGVLVSYRSRGWGLAALGSGWLLFENCIVDASILF